jgi:hypothetical protein
VSCRIFVHTYSSETVRKVGIPPTQLVDRSYPAYIRAHPRVPVSHLFCPSPSEGTEEMKNKSLAGRGVGRLSMNNPPTALVGFPQLFAESLTRWVCAKTCRAFQFNS